jgi:adenosylcobinamide-GDP ribazoletransferase
VSGLRTAIAFLTRVPVGGGLGDMRAAVPWLPIAGALIGLAVGGAYAGMVELVPATVAAAVAVLLGVLVTGAFHEDGLADVADAFAGGWTRDDRLRILDDPRHGSYGVAALCGSIVVRILALAPLGPAVGFAAAVAAHTLGRASALMALTVAPQAKTEGLGATIAGPDGVEPTAGRAGTGRRWIGVAAGLTIALAAIGWWTAVAALLAIAGTALVAALAVRKIGGVSGDVLGAIEQVVECTTLIAVTALATRHPLWWR